MIKNKTIKVWIILDENGKVFDVFSESYWDTKKKVYTDFRGETKELKIIEAEIKV